jgi:hypothetical protein
MSRIRPYVVSCLLLTAAAAALAASAHAQSASASLSALRRLRVPVVAPALLPGGFRLIDAHMTKVPPSQCGNCESYELIYGKGNAIISFFGTNWTAGGDADEDAFGAYFKSPLFGRGVVSIVHDVAVNQHREHSTCLTAFQLGRRNNTSVFLQLGQREYYYMIRACDSNLAPADLAAIINSARIIRP